MLRQILKIEKHLIKREPHLTWKKFNSSNQDSSSNSTPLVQSEKDNLPIDTDKKEKKSKSFAQMFKESQFVALGNLENKYLVGKIVDVVGDDLYIDYGGKFNCVCKIPKPEIGKISPNNLYKRNYNVKIRLLSFEMSSFFLNSARDITLLESDAELIKLVDPIKPYKMNETERARLLMKDIEIFNAEPYY